MPRGREHQGQSKRRRKCKPYVAVSPLSCWRPTETSAEGLTVELALNGVDGAALKESEDLIVQIEAVRDHGEAFRELVGALKIDLKVRVKRHVPVRTLGAVECPA